MGSSIALGRAYRKEHLMKTDLFSKKFAILSLCTALIVTSFGSLRSNAAPAADAGADLIALLRNPSKLQEQASKFSRAVDRLRPLANKTVFTDSDLALIDSFIKEKDGGEEVVLHARSKSVSRRRAASRPTSRALRGPPRVRIPSSSLTVWRPSRTAQ